MFGDSQKHVAWFYDLEDEEAGQLFISAKIIARKLKRAFNPEFVTVIIRGQRIPHAHIILQPSGEGDPTDNWLTTMRSSFKLAPEELLDDMVQKIQKIK